MPLLPVIALCAVVLLVAYFTYARLVMRWLGVDSSRPTPATERADGNDFVPAPAGVVLGGHFTAIAAAGPVVGPILAGLAFGWVPAMIWIVLGAIFVGAVHDSGALLASVRHGASSITQVVREHMSRTAYLTFLAFVWISLLYVIVAFTDVVTGTFARFQTITFPGANGAASQTFTLNGGAVAIGAGAYLLASILMGLALRFTRIPWYALLPLAVAGLGAVIAYSPSWAAALAPVLPFLQTEGKDAAALNTPWELTLLVYCFFASITPMWLLLQPRGVIGATFLYAALGFGVVGTLVGGWSGTSSLAIQYPAFIAFDSALGWMFPFLFITIACGACSGFHSIVASGTTCKQLRSEGDVRPVAYGAMLLEAMVAVFSLACVMILIPAQTKGASPDALYARGLGTFMSYSGVPLAFGIGFGLLAFSSFVFDTLDVCTRLGRYVLQEMTGLRGKLGGAIATVLTLLPPGVYLVTAKPGAFRTFWTLFGTSNQLLAALTLVGVSVWLYRTGRPVLFALVPAGFMLVTTTTALVLNLYSHLKQYQSSASPEVTASAVLNASIALTLLTLAAIVATEAVRVLRRARSAVATSPA